MKYLLRSEELLMFGASIYGLTHIQLDIVWWLYILLFFAPDLGMTGYLVNSRVGAFTYNLLHHKGLATGILVLGMIYGNQYLILAGLLLFGHASFDRIVGYGLKYSDSFQHTHLGEIGAGKEASITPE